MPPLYPPYLCSSETQSLSVLPEDLGTYDRVAVLMENATDHVARLVDAPAEDAHLDRRQRHEPFPVCALLGRSAAARYEDEVACHTGAS